ncbi:hypothetical protein FHG87_000300 [Trinorchestia longiramus]|nr:hypothetical protein FHG87_000300 [Trinorchestia longiramus]
MSCIPYEQFLIALKGCSQPTHCFSCIPNSPVWIHSPCKTSSKSRHPKCYYPVKKFRHYHRPSFIPGKQQQFAGKHTAKKVGAASDEQNQPTVSSYSGAPAADSSPSTSAASSALAADSASSTALLHLNVLCMKKNKALRQKISRLQRKVAELEKYGNLADLEKLESLAKDHKDVLLRFIKLEKEKKALEKVIKSMKSKEEPALAAVTSRTVQVQTCAGVSLTPPALPRQRFVEQHQLEYEAAEDEVEHVMLPKTTSVYVQCALLTWESRRASWEEKREVTEQLLLERYHANINEVREIYKDVIEKYSDRCKELVRCHEAKETSLEAQIHELNSELEKVRGELAEAEDLANKGSVNDPRTSGRDAELSSAPHGPAIEHLNGLLQEWALAANTRGAEVDSLRQSIEDSLNKIHEALQQQNFAIADLKQLKETCESLKEENSSLRLKYESEMKMKAELLEKLVMTESRQSEIEAERHLHRIKEQELSAEHERETASLRRACDQRAAALEGVRVELSSTTAELNELNNIKLKLERSLREQQSVVAALQDQLEERIRENCSLNTRLEERSALLKKTEASLIEAREKYAALDADSNTQLSELKESVRLLTAAKESMTQSHESQVRQLKLEIDEMRVRNETFQRQLAAITSTYNHMFGATDGSDNNSP